MLYVIGKITNEDGNISFTTFETNTESTFNCTESYLRYIIIDLKLSVKNVEIHQGKVVVKQWQNEIWLKGTKKDTGAKYTILCNIESGVFKAVGSNERVWYATREMLLSYMKDKKIYNCIFKDGQYELMGMYNVIKDEEFEQKIAEQYARYIALTAMIGGKATFDYTIEGQTVRINKYEGENKNIIIPNFTTAIKQNDFEDTEIDTVSFGSGLEYIGGKAFRGCNMTEVVIPRGIKFTGRWHFQTIEY